MIESLPEGMQRLRPELDGIVAQIERRAPYGAVLLSSHRGLQIVVGEREERVIERPPTEGTVLTAFDGSTIHETSLGGFDLEKVAAAAHDFKAFKRGGALDAGPMRRGDYQTSGQIKADVLSLDDKLDRVRELHRRASGRDSRVVNVQVTYDERTQASVFRNRNSDLAQNVQRLRIMVLVVVSGKDGTRYNYQTKCTTLGWEDLIFGEDELETLIATAIQLLTARRIDPGEYTVIASPHVAGTLCHESFGHGVETDMFLKQRARAAMFVDRQVGSAVVNISDDPSVTGAFGSYFFDDEGELSAPTPIVEHGVFRRGITDFYSARSLDIPRTANGRRQDYKRKAYARMSNTFFERGTTPLQELFDRVEDGVYLESAIAGVEDPKGWGIQVTCHYAHEVKHGSVTGKIFAEVGITGYVPQLLESVIAAGDDWQLAGGFCGKGYKEMVETSTGGPHLLMKARLG